jgi:hypothetical protein
MSIREVDYRQFKEQMKHCRLGMSGDLCAEINFRAARLYLFPFK